MKIISVISDPFTIKDNYIKFLLAGVADEQKVRVSVVDADDPSIVLGSALPSSKTPKSSYIDVSKYKDTEARIVILDESSSGWLAVDSFSVVSKKAMSEEVSILESQLGYHPNDEKRVYFRSAYGTPITDPEEREFVIIDVLNGQAEVYRGEILFFPQMEYR